MKFIARIEAKTEERVGLFSTQKTKMMLWNS